MTTASTSVSERREIVVDVALAAAQVRPQPGTGSFGCRDDCPAQRGEPGGTHERSQTHRQERGRQVVVDQAAPAVVRCCSTAESTIGPNAVWASGFRAMRCSALVDVSGVERQRDPGDVAACVGHQPQNGVGDVLRPRACRTGSALLMSGPPWLSWARPVEPVSGELVVDHRGVHPGRMNRSSPGCCAMQGDWRTRA